MLSVKHSPGDAIPAFGRELDERRESVSVIDGEHARDVLPNHPAGAESASKEKKLDGQVTTRVIQSSSSSGDAEGLAWGSADEKVNWFGGGFIDTDPGEVTKVGDVRKASGEHGRGERRDLRPPRAAKAKRIPRARRRADSVAD